MAIQVRELRTITSGLQVNGWRWGENGTCYWYA